MPNDDKRQDPVSAAIVGFISRDMQGSLRDGFTLIVGLGSVAASAQVVEPQRSFMFYAGIVLTIWGIVAPIMRSVLGILSGKER